jgi:hypothetical protein
VLDVATDANKAASVGDIKGTLRQMRELARTYATLIDALNRHRGKGQQKVTVEHVGLVQVLAPALESLFCDHGAPITFHRGVVSGYLRATKTT